MLRNLVFLGVMLAHFQGFSRIANTHSHEPTPLVTVKFYSAVLTLPEIPGISTEMPKELNEAAFRKVYSHFEASEYHPFLKKVGDYRRGMSLSDWHYYGILADYSEQEFVTEGQNFQVLFQWFMLRKSGIDARLFHTATTVYLNVLSEDIEFGFYIMEQGGRKYANLTARRKGLKLDNVTASMPAILPDAAEMPFVMRMAQMPRLAVSDTVERLIEFVHKDQPYKIMVHLNKSWLQVMDDYPYYNQKSYFEVGMSREAENTLLPALRKLIESKTDLEKVQLLLSFTRTAFFYKEDAGGYGKEKPMTPEETLYHSYSDCEDRSALFFYLCRKLVGLPQIVLDFDTHVGCAVVLEGVQGDFYKYKDRRFVYCEPTGPQDLLKPGEMWEKVKAQNARILVEYIPE
ncbi:MAG TPA: hypothetical protein VHS96_15500 [Bacteroidia bacterium]|nr:hypothetical protein [Bacteroidia bacterium]